MAEQDNFDDEEDIVLAELDDGELVEQMHDDLYNGMKEEIEEGTNLLLGRGWGPSRRCSTRRSSRACASSASTSATASCSCPRC